MADATPQDDTTAPPSVPAEELPAGLSGNQMDTIVTALLATDAVNPSPNDGFYDVHEDDLEYLVTTVLRLTEAQLADGSGAPGAVWPST